MAETDAGFCPHGCYWDCEHRIEDGIASPERAALQPVHDAQGRTLMRCRECGGYFYDAVAHGREHQRMRQLGWLPEQPPRGRSGRRGERLR